MKKPPVLEVEVDDLTPEAIFEWFVVRFGDRCAAWLVRDLDRRRKMTRLAPRWRGGTWKSAMHLPKGAEEPPWFRIAIAFLQKRPGWKVSLVVNDARSKVYEIRFRERPPNVIPISIRRLPN